MNNLIQASVSTNGAAQSSKSSVAETASNIESSDDSSGFSAALASAESTEQQSAEDSSGSLSESLTNENFGDGSSLPAEDAVLWQALMLLQPEKEQQPILLETSMLLQPEKEQQPILWQTSMLLQPAENNIANPPQLQGLSLLDSKNNSVINPEFYKQDYFNILSMQNKEAAASLPAAMTANNISMQLAGAQFIPDTTETLMMNVAEQLQPIPGVNTTLSQSLAAIGLGTATQAAATQTQMLPLNLGQNAWESNLGSRLQMMVGQNVQTAEIRLDPPELGALDIKIKITNDVASVNINSAHAHVRDALETAIPKLREMFAESGISLGDVNVQQESFTQQQSSADSDTTEQQNIAKSDVEDEKNTVHRKIVSNGLLDIYA